MARRTQTWMSWRRRRNVDCSKVWADSELEISTLFEVPKESNSDAKHNVAWTKTPGIVSNSTATPVIENNSSMLKPWSCNCSIATSKIYSEDLNINAQDDTTHDKNESENNRNDDDASTFNLTMLKFKGVPKCLPVDTNTIVLRRSPRMTKVKLLIQHQIMLVSFTHLRLWNESPYHQQESILCKKNSTAQKQCETHAKNNSLKQWMKKCPIMWPRNIRHIFLATTFYRIRWCYQHGHSK